MTNFQSGQLDEPVRYDTDFVGRGFYWPMQVDHTGSIRLTTSTEDIARSMQVILMTAPGERVMRPDFGCHIWDLLFEPITPGLFGLIIDAVLRALEQWEPRARVDSVEPSIDPYDDGLVRIAIRYRVRATNDSRNLVFPFYVIPHEPE